ncbi:hypothetical protein PF010_g4213 [Phytophthora fragariae]|uniref:Endonuclease/exonuclease/phosphatase domain-containing protein n=1 Tax=Phytophthora fragariae TaxID=53985 RepID=A0A6G0LSY1_9STRA|nr:hypothetical protein PF010_g4213 [Phytophthora fragariae]
MEAHWSSHFMAVTGNYAGATLLFVCIYAPHRRAQRENFYRHLSKLELPRVDKIVAGGDYNCTMDSRLDRSWYRKVSDHESPALAHLLAQWGLVDAQAPPDDIDHVDMHDYYETTHTYEYSFGGGVEATARLDRWYVSAPLVEWVASVEVWRTGTQADHEAVRLHLRSPTDPIRVRKPARVYPPPPIAQDAVSAAITQRLQAFLDTLPDTGANMDAGEWATAWDQLKVETRKETLLIIKQRRKMARATYKQRLRRLRRQESRIQEDMKGCPPSVEMITDALDALNLQDGFGGTPLKWVRHAIDTCTRQHAATHRQRLFREGGYHSGKTTKALFNRISNKYADNEVHRLDAAAGHTARGVHEKADTLADAWTPIFQQRGSTPEARAEVLEWLGPRSAYTAVLEGLTEPVTEAEVAEAFGALKRGKACGPDRLSNDWYRDHADLLVPIMTRLYNCWIAAGVFPATFLEADIFCLKKGGGIPRPFELQAARLTQL